MSYNTNIVTILIQYYLKYRNTITNTIKEAKTKFYKSELEKAGNDSKLNWKVIKNATNRSKTNFFTQIINNKFGEKLHFADKSKEISNYFNEYFTNAA